MTLPPLAAEQIFNIGPFHVTNTLINAWLAIALFGVFAFLLNLGMKRYYAAGLAPKGVLNFFESILETIITQIDNVTHDRKKTLRFLPIVGSIFLFILVSNWMGLLPGTGSIGRWLLHNGELELIPLLRPANTDLNLTLGMAMFVVLLSHVVGVAAIGFFKYANKFVKLGDLYQAFKAFNPMKIFVAVIEFFVGLLEVISEVAKMVSLSLRLFGNIFAGEVLLTVIAGLVAFFIPLPFMVLELIVGIVQAMVFSILTLVYLTMATQESHGHASVGEGKAHVEMEEDQAPSV